MHKKNRKYIWILDHGKKLTFQNGRTLIARVCMDITESMDLQQELEEKSRNLLMKNQELERFYHTIISGIAKILNDASLTLRYANEYLGRMLGYSEKELRDVSDVYKRQPKRPAIWIYPYRYNFKYSNTLAAEYDSRISKEISKY